MDVTSLLPASIPSRPRVLATGPQLDRIAGWLRAGAPLLVACVERIRRETRETPDFPDGWPPTGAAAAHRAGIFHIERLALLARLTGDAACFDRALAGFRALARAYLTFPDRPGGMRAMTDDLAEHTLLQHAARTFDLLASIGLGPADLRLGEDLLRTGVHVLDGEHHRDCGNHNTSGVVMRIVLGSALGDLNLIREGLQGCNDHEGKPRYGLIHHLEHDILADGVWWERTTGYHCYCLYLLCEGAWALGNLGVDLWHAPLGFAQRDEGLDMHRAYRDTKETRTLKSAFDAAIYWSPAGLRLPLVHDAFADNLNCYYEWGPLFEYAFDAYGEPAYAWMIEQAERAAARHPFPDAAPGVPASLRRPFASCDFVRFARPAYLDDNARPRFDWRRDAAIGLTGIHRGGSTLLPDTGTAVLRSGSGPEPQTGVSLHFGPHAAGHMSPANLHVELFDARGRLTDAPRSQGFDDPHHLTWLRTTIAHNTVTVDATPMQPCHLGGESIWEADRWHKIDTAGELIAFTPGAEFSVARAANVAVYPGVRLDRTLILVGPVLIDLFRVTSEAEHLYDWAMHPLGAAARPAGARTIDLGKGLGYRHLRDAAELPSPGAAASHRLRWAGREGEVEGLIVPPRGASVVLAEDPIQEKQRVLGMPVPPEPRGGVIVRTRAREAVFVSAWRALEPGAAEMRLTIDRAEPAGEVVLRLGLGGAETTWRAPMVGPVERVKG